MEKFKNKYRIPSARAPWWNYGNNGFYLITLCTAEREYLFGYIKNNEMVLSDIGNIVQQEWEKSFEIRTELFCDAFVIMPNHIHGIVRIYKNGPNAITAAATTTTTVTDANDDAVETHGRASLQSQPRSQSRSKPQPQPQSQTENHGIAYRPPKSISSFVAGFKSSATKRINEHRNTPKLSVWQSRFHDHIIRNQDEYIRIKQYIETNPGNWEKDEFFIVETHGRASLHRQKRTGNTKPCDSPFPK